MKKAALIGLGQRGKILLKEFSSLFDIVSCNTLGDIKNKRWLQKNYPHLNFIKNYEHILNDSSIEIVIIATPIRTHYTLAYKALSAGKHVFLEKPISEKFFQAKKLINIAQKKNLVLFIGHNFIYHPIFTKIRAITKKDSIKYVRFDWMKNGTFEEDIMYNLFSHDLSIILELIGIPHSIRIVDTQGHSSHSDFLTITLFFNKNKKCIVNINRNSNFTKKAITIITKKNLYVWDYDVLYKYNRNVNVFKPIFKTKQTPLSVQCKEFRKNINRKTKDYSNASLATNVIRIIERLQK